ETSFRIALVPAVLVRQPFGIKSPTLDIGRVPAENAEAPIARQSGDLLRQGDLKMMAGHRLVITLRSLAQDLIGRSGQGQVEDPRTRSVRCWIVIVRSGGLLGKGGLAQHFHR